MRARTVLSCVLAVMMLLMRPAHAYVYFTPPQLLASFFPEATVTASVFTPDSATLDALRVALGAPLPKPAYTIQVARRDGAVTGYAILDEQIGQHEPIDFGVQFDSVGKVQRIEVLVYREAYGDGVRGAPFRKQFVGLDARASMRAGKDIRIVSGATYSSRAIATGVKRVTALLEAWRAAPPKASP